MPKSPAEKQRAYRARKAAKQEPAKKAGNRIVRRLTDHPEKLAKFEAFMLQMNREIKDSLQAAWGKLQDQPCCLQGLPGSQNFL